MAEESAAASHNLATMSDELARLVAQFKLDERSVQSARQIGRTASRSGGLRLL
ncbi:hypothetical protein GOB76_04790 [Acetobacter peroxydans]|nr:hypothetical protein [Acetobacter peroxydans]